MINVTKPNLPLFENYIKVLEGIWKRNWLTNNGPLVNELELKLKSYLEVDHLLFLNNGTLAIQIAMKALKLDPGSEIITTPFSFVATTSSIKWEGFDPIFVDIDAETFNINPSLIEDAITENTSAILATHVFGNPCDIEAIDKIAKKHNLKVIYDAAHCFGTNFRGKSIFNYGDVSTTSFHATKLFHTVEGGGIFTKDSNLLKTIASMRNFGYNGPEDFDNMGINGKNSELHAAMGICNLELIDDILLRRKEMSKIYSEYLCSTLQEQKISSHTNYNFSYYPVVFETEEMLLKVVTALKGNYVFPRRYFYPSLNTISYVRKQDCPVSEDISKRILCLPLFYGMTREEVDFISRIILRTLKY